MSRLPDATPARPSPRQGFAALTVVMVLFFVMALVAAYTNRNMLFEQRISANSYRSARAMGAADAGVDWTLAMLNRGRIDINCQPSNNPADDDFRRRYMDESNGPPFGDGAYTVKNWTGGLPRLRPACINRDNALTCICPTAGNPNPGLAAPVDGIGSTFRVGLLPPGQSSRIGSMQFEVRGCANPGAGVNACASPTDDAPVADALSGAITMVGLVSALPRVPVATLTAGTTIDAMAGELHVSNSDGGSGGTAHAGNNITAAAASEFVGPTGSGADGRLENDLSLRALAAQANDGWFRAMFGMDRANYQRQPAVVRLNCAAGCGLADITNQLAGYPRNPIWVDGDLTLANAGALGTAANPLMLIVTGTLTLSANVQVTGFVHANAIRWSAGADLASVTGAMVAATDFVATSVATLRYDAPVLDTIRLRYGSFVRAPGGWNLWNAQ